MERRISALLFGVLLVVPVVNSQFLLNGGLANPQNVRRQLNCLQDIGVCDRTGRMIKAALPEVIGRNCARCTPQQRLIANTLVNFAQQNYPREWQAIRARYG